MSAPGKEEKGDKQMENVQNSFADISLSDALPSEGLQGDDKIPLEPLYKMCMKYYKDNVGKSLGISYQEKTLLTALHKQVTCGKYKPGVSEEPGFLDVVGNDRKAAWIALADMSKEDAMKEFVRVLNKCSPSLKPSIIAFKVQLDEEAKRKQQEEEEKRRREEEEERQRQQAAAAQAAATSDPVQVQQEQQVRAALNQQTEAQFRSYAQSQFPNDPQQQEGLIKQLQEQHFQQYVRQVYEQQMKQQQTQTTSMIPGDNGVNTNTQASSSAPQRHHAAAGASSGVAAASAQSLPGTTLNEQINGHDGPPTDVVIQEASMWTQKDVIAFKNAIKKESRMENHTDCIIKVGSGETVTIRVPTHENGNCLFWEFATDHYDIAFGVYFEWTISPDDNVQVHVSDSSDDEDEEGAEAKILRQDTFCVQDKSDAERGGDAAKKSRGPPIDEIIPIYRRDSHEEVYCGSHVYPGRGVYLLKFDNSYSLWRSKTLYYRVYYSR